MHLVVIQHGLWGVPEHVRYLEKSLQKHKPTAQTLIVQSNEWVHTYDGIDVCAQRMLKEVDAKKKELEDQGKTLDRISFVGYSLGGLVCRYAIGTLEKRGFLEQVEPVSFSTFASPWLGVVKYNTMMRRALFFFGTHLLSRSGQQLHLQDKDLGPSPLLETMATKGTPFMKGLAKFKTIQVFANAVNDRTVPFTTGAIELHDPFRDAYNKAEEAIKKSENDPLYIVPDLRFGGLDVHVMEDSCLVGGIRRMETPLAVPLVHKKTWSMYSPQGIIDHSFLRFMSPWVAYPVMFTAPVSLPLLFGGVFTYFARQGIQSRRRVAEIAGMLEDAEDPGMTLAYVQQVALPELQGQEDVSTANERPNAYKAPRRGSDAASHTVTSSGGKTKFHDIDTGNPEHTWDLSLFAQGYPTDAQLSERQKTMAETINSLPQLKKHIACFEESFNAHGTIVCRSETFHAHRNGKKLVDYWAKQLEI